MGVVWPNWFETGLSASVNGANDILYGEIMTPPICSGCQEERGRLQTEVEAKDTEIDRQQREMQTLRVRN